MENTGKNDKDKKRNRETESLNAAGNKDVSTPLKKTKTAANKVALKRRNVGVMDHTRHRLLPMHKPRLRLQ